MNLDKFELFLEEPPGAKKRVRASVARKLQADIRKEFWFGLIKSGYNRISRLRSKLKTTLSAQAQRVFKWYKKPRKHLEVRIKFTWTKVLILFILGAVLWPNEGKVIAVDPAVSLPSLNSYPALTAALGLDEIPKAEYLPIIEPEAPSQAPSAVTGNIEQIITKWANNYDVSPERLLRVARCESGLNAQAHNPSGATGLFQFMPSTFYSNGGIDIYSAEDQSRVAALMFSQGQAGQWVCQ